MSGNELNAIAAAILVAFGITVPMPDFVGGMIIAFGACFAVMAFRPIEERRGVIVTLLAGSVAGMFAAILHKQTHSVWLWGVLPLQAQMGIAGGMSQAIAESMLAFGRGMAKRAARIPDNIPIPGVKDSGEKQ